MEGPQPLASNTHHRLCLRVLPCSLYTYARASRAHHHFTLIIPLTLQAALDTVLVLC